jgi:hypothetical protein
MSNLICCFCGSSFKTASTLSSHKARAKYCLKLRNSVANTCRYCKRTFLEGTKYNDHVGKCRKTNADAVVDSLQEENNTLTEIKNSNLKLQILKVKSNLLGIDPRPSTTLSKRFTIFVQMI